MNGGKSNAVKVKAHSHRRRHTSKHKHGKKTKQVDRHRKQVKDKVKVARVHKESDGDSSGTLFTPVKKSTESPKKSLENISGQERERAQLEKKLQLINKCLECLTKQKRRVMQQLEDSDNGDVDMI